MKYSLNKSNLLLVSVSIALIIAACGKGGPARYRVSGTVRFDGKPVHSGRIQFVPDHSRGGSGPAGYARISNGQFDTSKDGQGAVGGPHVAQIQAFTGKMITITDQATGETQEAPELLFSLYEERVDLPTAAATRDFEVPASARSGYKGFR